MHLFNNKIIKKLSKNYYQSQKNKVILDYYRMQDLESQQEIYIKDNVELNQIDNLYYIKKDTLIKFLFHPTYDEKDEFIFYQKLTEIFKILENHDRVYNIRIYVENRELFKQSKALEHVNNINLIIYTDSNEYTKEEYLEEEIKLDSLVESIKHSNLSPYEKYLAVYNIVKQFKEYLENVKEPHKSRDIKEILNNDYMVCVGYANLLTILLDKVGIPCISISAVVEDKYNTPLHIRPEERPTILCGHERNLIKIDDDKYNIHGIYIADATFDNNMNVDLYNNVSITYDKLKQSDSLEKIRFDDYIFDAHNFNEFKEKVNFCLNYEIKSKHIKYLQTSNKTYQEKVTSAYKYIYQRTLRLLYKLDKQKWTEFTDKYNELLSKEYESLKEIEKIYSEFLTGLGHYIIQLSNKEIPIDTTLQAAKVVKKVINGYRDEQIDEWERITKEIYQEVERRAYPYRYNPNETRINYLENKYESRLRVKKLTHSK